MRNVGGKELKRILSMLKKVEETMIENDNEVTTALLLERFFIWPSRDQISEEFFLAFAAAVNRHPKETSDKSPKQLKECNEGREVVLYAESGAVEPTDSLLAVYVAKGSIKKTVENMSRLRSKGTVDFEGKMKIVESDLSVNQSVVNAAANTKHDFPSKPSSANRIDESSDLYSKTEQVWVFGLE